MRALWSDYIGQGQLYLTCFRVGVYRTPVGILRFWYPLVLHPEPAEVGSRGHRLNPQDNLVNILMLRRRKCCPTQALGYRRIRARRGILFEYLNKVLTNTIWVRALHVHEQPFQLYVHLLAGYHNVQTTIYTSRVGRSKLDDEVSQVESWDVRLQYPFSTLLREFKQGWQKQIIRFRRA